MVVLGSTMADASLSNDVLSGQDSLAVSELNPLNGVVVSLVNATVVREVILDGDLVIGAVLKADDQVVLIDIARVTGADVRWADGMDKYQVSWFNAGAEADGIQVAFS